MFGADFDKKCNPPTGTWVALKFASLIDPALEYDVYCEKPWLLSPLLCSMNILNVQKAPSPTPSNCAPLIGKNVDPNFKPNLANFTSGPADKVVIQPSGNEVLGKWEWGKNHWLEENNALLLSEDRKAFPSDGVSERRKYFQKPKNRQNTKFTPDKLYNFEVKIWHLIQDFCTLFRLEYV